MPCSGICRWLSALFAAPFSPNLYGCATEVQSSTRSVTAGLASIVFAPSPTGLFEMLCLIHICTCFSQEKHIYDLKKKNQELEKCKFVLDHRIAELKTLIEARGSDIKIMKKQIYEVSNTLIWPLLLSPLSECKSHGRFYPLCSLTFSRIHSIDSVSLQLAKIFVHNSWYLVFYHMLPVINTVI